MQERTAAQRLGLTQAEWLDVDEATRARIVKEIEQEREREANVMQSLSD